MNDLAVRPSQNNTLSNAFSNFERQLYEAAKENVLVATAGDDSYTAAEISSMVIIEELKLTNGMELATILIRYKLIRTIRDGGMWANHPNGYTSLEEMSKAQGITTSELSDTIQLCEVIFPYIETTLRIPIAQIWEEIGKSNFRELTPILREVITGEPSQSNNVHTAAEGLVNDAIATLRAAGMNYDPDAARAATVDHILEVGHLTNREMRQHIRRDRTPSIQAAVINHQGGRIITMQVTEDQWTTLNRLMNGHMDTQVVDLPADQRTRQSQILSVAPLRSIWNLVEGR